MSINLNTKDIERFWSKVIIPDNTDDCWNWSAGTFNNRYGQFQLNKTPVLAHRVSWFLHNGNIPDGMFICHHCDNPLCVNPKHLFVGTSLDNHRDMDNKNRRKISKGEDHGQHKLTPNQVKEIRKRYIKRSKDNNTVTLAKEFDVSFQEVYKIVNFHTWKSIE